MYTKILIGKVSVSCNDWAARFIDWVVNCVLPRHFLSIFNSNFCPFQKLFWDLLASQHCLPKILKVLRSFFTKIKAKIKVNGDKDVTFSHGWAAFTAVEWWIQTPVTVLIYWTTKKDMMARCIWETAVGSTWLTTMIFIFYSPRRAFKGLYGVKIQFETTNNAHFFDKMQEIKVLMWK